MKRQFGVALIGCLLLVQGAVLMVELAANAWLLGTHRSPGSWPEIAVNIAGHRLNEWLSAIVVGVLGIVSMAVGIGILRLRPLAWFVAMVLQGWTLATLLLDYFIRGQGNYASMLLAVVIVFYLNTRVVRETFDLARSRSAADAKWPSSPAKRDAPADVTQESTSLNRVNETETAAD